MTALTVTLQNALRHMQRKPLRTSLTLLQVVLGVLMVTVTLHIYLAEMNRRDVSDTFSVRALVPGRQVIRLQAPFRQSTLDELLTLAPDVQALALHSPLHYRPKLEVAGERYMFPQAAQVSANYFELLDLELVQGSFFTEQEAEENRRVVVLEEGVAQVVFGGERSIGRDLTVLPFSQVSETAVTYQVIGTFRYATEHPDGGVSALSRFAALFPPDSGGSTNLVVLADPGRGSAAREQILAATRQTYPSLLRQSEDADFFLDEADEAFSFFRTLNPTLLLFGLFGITALILASVGIFSATVVDIAERTHEVGVRRSLGANRVRIAREFMSEAAILALLGAAAGVALAWLALPFLASQVGDELFSDVRLSLRPLVSLLVLVVTVLLSAGLGFLPAWNAGRKRPVEALREV